MKNLSDWCKTYCKEIGFAGVVVFIVISLCSGADRNPVNGSIYNTFGLILLLVAFCAGVVMLGQNAQTSQRTANLKLFTVNLLLLAFCWLIAYSCKVQQAFAATDVIKLCGCGVLCLVACGWYLERRKLQLEKWENLREGRPDEYLRELIKHKRQLNSEQQLKIFYLADAENLLFQYMQYEELTASAEIRLFEEPFTLRLIKHLPHYSFSEYGDARMFVVDIAPALVLQYVENGNVFSSVNEIKMFDLPNADEIVNAYICNSSLSDEEEMRLFELPNAQELVEYYANTYGLCDAARKKAEERGWI